jgi:hypothetical protein
MATCTFYFPVFPLIHRIYAPINTPFQLKKDYEIVRDIRNQSGWGWDNTTLLPIVPPLVWDEYVRVSFPWALDSFRHHPTADYSL